MVRIHRISLHINSKHLNNKPHPINLVRFSAGYPGGNNLNLFDMTVDILIYFDIKTFEEVRICKMCGGEVKENHRMGHSWCTGCGMIEPDEKIGFMCSECLEICTEEKCDCE